MNAYASPGGAGSRTVFIGVNYDTPTLAARFVRQVTALKHAPVATVLVDNSSDLGEHNYADEANGHRFLYVAANSNLGYLNGANLGLQEFIRRRGEFDWLVVANVDLDFRDTNFAASLGTINYESTVGIVAPAIWSSNALRNLNPYLVSRPNRQHMRFYTLLYRSVFATNAYIAAARVRSLLFGVGRESRRHMLDNRIRTIYAAHGSCMVFSRAFFERGGHLRYPSFLFGEEIHLAELTRKVGLDIWYNPTLQVWHDDHASTGFLRTRKSTRYMLQSATFLVNEYFDR